eukprot:2875630-Rhodomonas_salina.1
MHICTTSRARARAPPPAAPATACCHTAGTVDWSSRAFIAFMFRTSSSSRISEYVFSDSRRLRGA